MRGCSLFGCGVFRSTWLLTDYVKPTHLIFINVLSGFSGTINTKTMKNKILALIVATTLLSQSCATILSGTHTKVYVREGEPSNAKVFYNGNYMGEAPIMIKTSKKPDSMIEIKKEGYRAQLVSLESKIQIGFVIYYILFLDLISAAIDFGTGAVYKVVNKNINYDLEKRNN